MAAERRFGGLDASVDILFSILVLTYRRFKVANARGYLLSVSLFTLFDRIPCMGILALCAIGIPLFCVCEGKKGANVKCEFCHRDRLA